MKRSRRWRTRISLALLGLALLGAAILFLPLFGTHELTRVTVPPGADSVEFTAGAGYRGGALRRVLLGAAYREVWATPVRVEVLRLAEFEGGLRPVREGGGVQTRTLHFLAASGRRYVFRSLDKQNSNLLNAGLSHSLLAWLLNDQTSSSHPASALVAAPLQEAVGLPFPRPRLVVLPADSALQAFLPRYGGLPGILLENPGEFVRDPVPGDTARPKLIDTAPLLALLDSGRTQRADAQAFLTARLLDLFLNDWDRHQGQWRWAAQPDPGGGGVLWRPIPVDRDQAFSWYDGVVLSLLRPLVPRLAVFSAEYPGLRGLTQNSAELDRRFLAGLSRERWDSTATSLAARLTNTVIDAALRRMPEPWRQVSGDALAATLKARRDGLRDIASRFYLRLAERPVVHVAAIGELAQVARLPDGSVDVRVVVGPLVRLTRRFDPAETREIELRLHGGIETLKLDQPEAGARRIALRVRDAQGRDLSP